jgi:hypothetical protein
MMDIQLYAIHVVPFILIVYFACVLFMHPPKEVILASLAGGLVMGILNTLGDLLAYYASWWHYAASGLVLRLPLPFYLTPLFIFGGLAYLLIWRFSEGQPQKQEGISNRTIRSKGRHPQGAPLHFIPITARNVVAPRFIAGAPLAGAIPALALLIGVPLLGFARDILNAEITHSSFLVWDSGLAGPIDFVLWLLMFYAGYVVFRQMLAHSRNIHAAREEENAEVKL